MMPLLGAGLLAATHLVVGRLRFLDRNPDIWRSVAGGVGIAYAFLLLLPKLASAQEALRTATDGGLYGFLEHHSYLVALAGLILYYGLDIAVQEVLVRPEKRAWRPAVTLLVLTHASAMSGYFFLIGYLVGETRGRDYKLLLFCIPMLLHFLAIDHGLLHKYGGLYNRVLRWAFALATMAGAVLAITTEINYTTLALLNSLFAGVLIISTIKEELPSSRHGRFWPFLAGLIGFAVLLLLTEL